MMNFASIKKKTSDFLDGILNSGIETVIKYKMFVSSVYNESTGEEETTYKEYEIKSVRVDATLMARKRSTIMAGVSFGSGEIIYMIKHEDMPRANVYSPEILKDFVVDGSLERQVKTAVPLLDTVIKIQV
jgi:hypothetical protein